MATSISFESAGLNKPLTPLSPDGKALSIKDYRGAPILLHFWASWCEPCTHDEKPLNELFAALGGRGVHFVTVASEDHPDKIRKAGKTAAYPGDNYVDPTGELALAFSVKAYPQTILIDKDGQLIFREEGPLTDADLQQLKSELLASTADVLPAFSFADATGRNISSESLKNKVWVADFIFTSCGDTCPLISEKLRALQVDFGSDPRFRIISFSVDPKNDSPERLLAFGKKHGAVEAVWSFLRPPAPSLQKLMVQGFRLGTAENPLWHTAKIVVMGKGNIVSAYIDGDAQDAVPKLKATISALLDHGNVLPSSAAAEH